MIGGRVCMQFQIGSECSQGCCQEALYDDNRSAILTADLVGLCVDGNW